MRISRTGQRTTKAGFTLIEMLIVVSIIISITTILSIWFSAFLSSKEAYLEAAKVAGLSDLARNLAESKGVNHRVVFDPAANTVTLSGLNMDTLQYETPDSVRPVSLIDRVRFSRINTPRSDSAAAGSLPLDYITYYPDGSSESGLVQLESAKGDVFTLQYAATTGTVRLSIYAAN